MTEQYTVVSLFILSKLNTYRFAHFYILTGIFK